MEIKTINTNLFSTGLAWHPKHIIPSLAERIKIRSNKRKPNLIIIDGVSSSGKTTTAVHIMDEINRQHNLPPVDLSNECVQLGTGANDFIKKLKVCREKGLPCVAFDEAGEYNRRSWQSQLNKVMDSIIDTFRAYNIAIIMILHDFSELPKHVWSTRIVSTLIHLKERKKSYGRAYLYSQKRIYWIIKYKKDVVYPEDAYNKEQPNARMVFKNLSEERAKQLDILSTKHKLNKLDSSEIKLNGLVCIKDVMERLGRSRDWVAKQLSVSKAKPKMVLKKVKYYDENILKTLEYNMKR